MIKIEKAVKRNSRHFEIFREKMAGENL
jgi:hypothetical protein